MEAEDERRKSKEVGQPTPRISRTFRLAPAPALTVLPWERDQETTTNKLGGTHPGVPGRMVLKELIVSDTDQGTEVRRGNPTANCDGRRKGRMSNMNREGPDLVNLVEDPGDLSRVVQQRLVYLILVCKQGDRKDLVEINAVEGRRIGGHRRRRQV